MTLTEKNSMHVKLWRNGFVQMYHVREEGDYILKVHSNAIMVNPNVAEIKKLINKKFSVTGDTNTELITIK